MSIIYTVLIQNQKTMGIFRRYNPLFMELLNNECIGIAQWMEAGTTIDTAVPELYDMVNDKEQWRAVIVRLVDEEEMKNYPSSRKNPYDFDINMLVNSETGYQETEIPLIRLTQMLGDVPPPEVTFHTSVLHEEGMQDRVIYTPHRDPQESSLYLQLREKYRFEGIAPSEIILISVRYEYDSIKQDAVFAWDNKSENVEHDFWKRNAFPSNCRFLVYEMAQRGKVQREADLFRFWTSVLLVAENEIDPSTLQAYRLYKLDLQYNKARLADTIQDAVGRTLSAENYLEKSIENEGMQRLRELDAVKAPDYRMSVAVSLDTPATSDVYVKERPNDFVCQDRSHEIIQWDNSTEFADKAMDQIVKSVDRSLDRTAMGMRGTCFYDDSSVKELGDYQRSELTESLDRVRADINRKRKNLPEDRTYCMEELDKADRNVIDEIKKRVTNHQLGSGIGVFAIAMVLCCFPAMIQTMNTSSSVLGFCIAAGSFFLGGLIAAVFALAGQNSLLTQKRRNYNYWLRKRVAELTDSTVVYSDYLSTIATYIRGNSYVNKLHQREIEQQSMVSEYHYYLNEIHRYLDLLKKWGKALHLNANYSVQKEENEPVDIRQPSHKNPLFSLEYGKEYLVDLNSSGQQLRSTVGFVDKLLITQEELYDDAGIA